MNMRSVANKGFGIIVTLAEDMANDLHVAIEEMLKNTSYVLRIIIEFLQCLWISYNLCKNLALLVTNSWFNTQLHQWRWSDPASMSVFLQWSKLPRWFSC